MTGALRSARAFPASPEPACELLRSLFPGWEITYRPGLAGGKYTAYRVHASGRSGADGVTPVALARGLELLEDAER